MSPEGEERFRIEGFLSRPEFQAALRMGLGRVAFMQKAWDQARAHYEEVANDLERTTWLPEALYWIAVCKYKGQNDHVALQQVAEDLKRFPESQWTIKASVWEVPSESPKGKLL